MTSSRNTTINMASWGRASELNPYYGLSSDLEVKKIKS